MLTFLTYLFTKVNLLISVSTLLAKKLIAGIVIVEAIKIFSSKETFLTKKVKKRLERLSLSMKICFILFGSIALLLPTQNQLALIIGMHFAQGPIKKIPELAESSMDRLISSMKDSEKKDNDKPKQKDEEVKDEHSFLKKRIKDEVLLLLEKEPFFQRITKEDVNEK